MNPHHRWWRRLVAAAVATASLAGTQAVLAAAPAHAGQVVVDIRILGRGSVTVVEGTPEDGVSATCTARDDAGSNLDLTECPRFRNEEFFEAWSWLRPTPAAGDWVFDGWRGCHTTRVRLGATECAVKSGATSTDQRTVLATFVDRTPPPAPSLAVTTVPGVDRTVQYAGSAAGATWYQCQVPGRENLARCSNTGTLTLAEGRYTFGLAAEDRAYNIGALTTRSFSVVDTAIGVAPPKRTSSRSATFGVSSGVGTAFACRLDDGPWQVCASGATTGTFTRDDLAEGEHTMTVRASDGAWTDPVAATHSWTVDSVAPRTTLKGGPAEGSIVTSARVELGFEADEPASFSCRLDGSPVDCSQDHVTLHDLTAGRHTLSVTATDAAGNVESTPATRTWYQPVASRAMKAGKDAARGFKQVDSPSAYGGSEAVATRKGARLVGKVTGARTIALLVAPSNGQGKVAVLLGTKKVASFDLGSGEGRPVLLALPALKKPYTGAVVVVAGGTKPVRVQGLGWS